MIKTLLLLTALALVQAYPEAEPISSRRYEAHPDCPPAEIHFLLPHEYDCTKFYYCEYGLKWIEPRDCAPGTEFNAEIQVCVHPASSGCHLPGYSTEAGPVTAPPTTAAPAPTTAAPVTAAPTTAAPVTAAPTTAAPVTAAPTTAAPVTTAPTTTTAPVSISSTPVTVGPSTVAPSTSAPVVPTTLAPEDCEPLANGCPSDFTVHKLLPHEEYCHKFYYCDKGELVLRYCAPGTYFNPELEVCDWPFNVDCVNDGSYEYPSTAGPAPTTPGGGNDIGDVLDNGCPADFTVHHLLPHETQCDKFYYCVFGEKVERSCAPGTHFNFEIQVCDWPANVGCVSLPTNPTTVRVPDSSEEIPNPSDPVDPEDPWVPLPNGCPSNFDVHHLLPHESDCGKFYYCVNGLTVVTDCPAGLHFSPWTQTCDWPVNAGCEHWVNPGPCNPNPDGGCTSTAVPVTTTTSGPGGITVSSTPSVPDSSEEIPNPSDPVDPVDPVDPEEPCEPLPNGCPSDFDVHQLLPHESDCGKFYYCVNGETVESSCPAGLHFSPWTQTCDWPVNAGCEHWINPGPCNPSPDGGCTSTAEPIRTTTVVVPDSSEEIPNPSDPVDPADPEEPWVPLPNGCPSNFDVHHLLPHESDCGKFYYCVNGDLVVADCPAGLHFSPWTQTCDWPVNAGCDHWINPGPCNPNPDGGCTSTAVPVTPTTSGPGGITVSSTPSVPDSSEEIPNPSDPVDPADPEDPWVPLPNGCPADFDVHHLLPHESDCGKFYYCVYGDIVEAECPPGLHFSPSTQTCDWPQYAGCEHWVNPNPCPNPNPGGGCTSTAEPSTTTQGTTTQGTTTQGTTTQETTTLGTTTTTEDPPCDTQPAFTTTLSPNTPTVPITVDTTSAAPITTPQIPIIPVDKCQNECNIAPWAHDDCDKFWICSGNQAIVINCSEGLQFNPQTYSCDFNCNVGCVRNTIQATAGYDGVKVFLPWNQVDENMMKALKIEL